MASMVLSYAGSAIGGMFGFGDIGGMVGRFAGSMIDKSIMGGGSGGSRAQNGPRLKDLDVLSSTEGAPIPRLYGRMRLSGQVIWATKLEEVVTERESGGGKGGGMSAGGGGGGEDYSYFANFAVGICEGETAYIARIWADNKPLDLAFVTYRFYRGTETQNADPLIVAKKGADNAPAYRGLSYIVFERLPLDRFGGRIPQLSFEIIRPVGDLEKQIKSVVMIPGSTEFGYAPQVFMRNYGYGNSAAETRHTFMAGSDFTQSLEELLAICPNLTNISLVVSWFGTDLRAGECLVKPGVEIMQKAMIGTDWMAGGVTRAGAHYISRHEGKASYGGTPGDQSVIDAIHAIKAKGIKVTFYPFMMMDIPVGNAMGQPPYPWRGQITTSVDNSALVASEVTAFVGTATASDFDASGGYAGPNEWSFRRLVHHYARLVARAGGVDAFIIGSEMIGMSRMRSSSGVYPFVDALTAIATEVKAVIPNSTLTYAADWTEYGAHVLNGAQEIRFPLDKLWASPAIGAVGIDYYAPISDWRDGDHLDMQAGSIYSRDYLQSNIFAGEAYDFYYASPADRAAQIRSPITDGAYNKPWIYRQKDIRNWWSQPHIERLNGVETVATPWIPQSKPMWLTEYGVPAVDKGTNQPSVFPDPKSSVAAIPYFSSGRRDDAMLRSGLSAFLSFFDLAWGADPANNPISSLYHAPMLDVDNLSLWAWDARPFPTFPLAIGVWSDGGNWQTGHWLNGRLGSAPLSGVVHKIAEDYGVLNIDASCLAQTVDGYVLDRTMSMRDALEPLAHVFQFNPIEEGLTLKICSGHDETILTLDEPSLVETKAPALVKITRAQTSELPGEITLAFNETFQDFRMTAVSTRRLTAARGKNSRSEIAVAAGRDVMEDQANKLLHALWAGAETFDFTLPVSSMRLTVGDVIVLHHAGKSFRLRITQIEDGFERKIAARALGPSLRSSRGANVPLPSLPLPEIAGPPHVEVFEIPHINKGVSEVLSYLAVSATPWARGYALSKSAGGSSFTPVKNVTVPSLFGVTVSPLAPSQPWLWDRVNTLDVRLTKGQLASLSEERVFGGENSLAVKNVNGVYEVVQFQLAELIAPLTYRLSMLLRGQAGSEATMAAIAADAPVIFLDKYLTPLNEGVENYNRPVSYRLVPFGLDAGDVSVVTFDHTASSVALKPLAPQHLKAVRVAGGIQISFIRRTRLEGDSWEVVEVPLGEASESYVIEIFDGVNVVRTLSLASETTLYADEITDFGAAQTSLTLRVRQVSATVGAGFETVATLIL
jgi:hypothetical protein